MKYRITIELTDVEKKELTEALQTHPLKYEQGQWRQMTEMEVKEGVVWCIVSTQTKWASVEKLHELTKGRQIWNRSVPEIEKLLRHSGIRFPKKKANWIASLSGKQVKEAIAKFGAFEKNGVDSSRNARSLLKDELGLKGLGDKQMSHLLTKHLFFSPDLVPIDSRWLGFFRSKGLFGENDDPSYVMLEDLVIALANELGVKPVYLDQAVWEMTKEMR
jgi:thermostable 8-oxoguanine DNA glycosylase